MTREYASVIAETAARLRGVGIADAQLEAEVLLAHATSLTRTQLLAKLTNSFGESEFAGYRALVERRLRHEPIAYIAGHREFYGIDIRCDRRALIPRPETEMLVDLALEELRERGDYLRIIDVGTGTGAIALAIAATNTKACVLAVDASSDALALAADNGLAAGVSGRVLLERGELLVGTGEFDLILANLPYVSRDDWAALPAEIRDWEPSEALIGGERGTEVIEALLDAAPAHLAPSGVLALEIGAGQAASVIATARRCFPTAEIHARKDLAGIDRVVVVRMQRSRPRL